MVGCPTRNRTWILPEWKKYVEAAVPDDWFIHYIFVVGDDDEETIDLLETWEYTQLVKVMEDDPGTERSWADKSRYDHMSYLRNVMLHQVQKIQPDLFLSLDSDILIHPDAICNLYESMLECNADAVGGLTYFDPIDVTVTNVANWKKNAKFKSFQRVHSRGVHEVDIIMGIKLMAQEAYNINYSYHDQGEDLGWAVGMQDKKVVFDGRNPSKHVMYENWLDIVDKRVGY